MAKKKQLTTRASRKLRSKLSYWSYSMRGRTMEEILKLIPQYKSIDISKILSRTIREISQGIDDDKSNNQRQYFYDNGCPW